MSEKQAVTLVYFMLYWVLPANGAWDGESGKQQRLCLFSLSYVNVYGLVTILESIWKLSNLTEPQLLIGSSGGLFHVPLSQNGFSPPELKFVVLNAFNPSGIQCDAARGYIYWAEENGTHSSIFRASVNELEKVPETIISSSGENPLDNEVLGRQFMGTDA